ncbi:PREDICTED: uncharacterized protein LOC108380981 [Rhagoletis zephyria]|uniref:uncharacterized protein LOC108380981 n=1 Tax=Rhagoletis zephyria TaxID=28612 RepID=UPI0008113732|nr:PREDICTED: uncharacterized protein LOC108380981 [Rhagoletis zephyria]
MHCLICKEKVDRADSRKIACSYCKNYYHGSCAKLTFEDIEYMKANSASYRCDSCVSKRRKTLHQEPLPSPSTAMEVHQKVQTLVSSAGEPQKYLPKTSELPSSETYKQKQTIRQTANASSE